jgi:orotate phosphoribosyltransferase
MVPEAWDIELREAACKTARMLLETESISYDRRRPFRLASGLVSPIHIDCRRLMSYPTERRELVALAERMIRHETAEMGEDLPDAVAAGEGAGVPFATLLADRLDVPLIYVRKEKPEEPFKRQVEGMLEPGWRVLLVEQLAVDGHRKARFARPLWEAGAVVSDALVVFQYGIFNDIHDHLAPLGITLHALANWWDLLEVARQDDLLPEEVMSEIAAFLHDPTHWSDRGHRTAPAAA